MQPTIPPPFPIEITFTSLISVVTAVLAISLTFALWGQSGSVEPLPVKNRYDAKKFLAIMMLSIAVLLTENFLEITGYFYYTVPLMGLQFPFAFLLGPALYFYVCTETAPDGKSYAHRHLLHLIPSILAVILLSPTIFNPSVNAKLLTYYAYAYSAQTNLDVFNPGLIDFDARITLTTATLSEMIELKGITGWMFLFDVETGFSGYFLLASLAFYFGLSFRKVKSHSQVLKAIASSTKRVDLSWISRFLFLLGVISVLFATRIVIVYWLDMQIFYQIIDIMMHTVLGVSVFYLGQRALMQTTIFSPELAATINSLESGSNRAGTILEPGSKNSPEPSHTHNSRKYGHSALPAELSNELAAKIKESMESKEHYLDSELTLPGLAESLNLTTHTLSQVLNETIGMNFFDFVNSYRINVAKSKLASKDFSDRPISQIALDSGFNSSSAFYLAFKKSVKMTPSNWRKSQIK